MVNDRQWASPGLEQVAELVSGVLPREFQTLDEVPGSFRGLWPTPTATPYGSSQNGICKDKPSGCTPSLERQARCWPTPVAGCKGPGGEGKREGGPTLQTVVNRWPTPTVNDSKNNAGPSQFTKGQGGRNLNVIASTWPTPTAEQGTGFLTGNKNDVWRPSLEEAACGARPSRQGPTIAKAGKPTSANGRVLNPQFVEALMGWPIGWSACDSSVTESSRSRQPQLSASSGSD